MEKNYKEILCINHKHEVVGVALVDDNDYEIISKYNWWLNPYGYAITTKPNERNSKLIMHRIIMNANANQQIDHINRNKLDNRKSNLRFSTQHQNSLNASKKKNNTSGIVGVWFDKSREKWAAQLKFLDKRYNLGRFDLFEDAVFARLNAEKQYYGEFAPQQHLYEQYGV